MRPSHDHHATVHVSSASPRLFESVVLDALSRVHFMAPVIIYAPIILALAAYSFALHSVAVALGWIFAGFAAWSLTEYLGHRWFFHLPPHLPGDWGPRLQFLIHGVHHEHPNDPYRLVMPPLLSAPILLIAFVVSRIILGEALTWPAVAGFIFGYLCYDCMHYRLHHGVPRFRWERRLRMLHMHHHFRDPTKGFGVLSIWWDWVFGTAVLGSRYCTRNGANDRSRPF
jgi:dihydroceramide fatty acyl 2-hydroxylase